MESAGLKVERLRVTVAGAVAWQPMNGDFLFLREFLLRVVCTLRREGRNW